MRLLSINIFIVLMLTGCCATSDNEIASITLEGDKDVRYRIEVNPDLAGKIIKAFVKKVGYFEDSDPIRLTILSDEWKLKCRSTKELFQGLGEACNSDFRVSQIYYIDGHREQAMRFVSEHCDSAGNCDYRVGDVDFGVEE